MPVSADRRRVAVIGSGLAGLTTAYLLKREGVEVWIIEKSDRLGFHSASVEIPLGLDEAVQVIGPSAGKKQSKGRKGGPRWIVDVPMRSFQGGYYPLLIALYRHLNIPMIPTYWTFSFSHLTSTPKPDTKPYFIHTGASGSAIPSLPSKSYASPRALTRAIASFLGTACAYLLWVVIAALGWHDLLPLRHGRQTTLRHMTARVSHHLTYPLSYFSHSLPRASALASPLGNVFEAFVYDIILPLFSAVGTMTTSDVLDTSIGSLLDYVHSTVGTSHFTLAPGISAGTVAMRLAEEVGAQGEGYLRVGEEVLDLVYSAGEGNITVKCRGGDIEVDQVVLATQASAAAVLLGMLEKTLKAGAEAERSRVSGMRDALSEVEYRETIVVTHRDRSILPGKADQREINLSTPLSTTPRGFTQDEDVAMTPALSTSSSVSSPGPSSPGSPSPYGQIPFFAPRDGCVYTMGTHIVPPPASLRQQGIDVAEVLQTTNPVCPIDAETVLAVSRMERALPLRDPTIFKRLHPSSSPTSHPALIHLAGSYAYPGIPLLEGCVGSAINATSVILGKPRQEIGGLDWSTGRGGRLGRIWRWRRSGIVDR
ncbi:uncharacterized protein MKK02DRAFT_34559 [Dioszegia hungarica]|uniref:Amine oxidase domain-containing protein n=1 Tax=Dioszegia hungarica TaxID=4972 RepID=A0AA38H6S7_9TREE|nr:uncharacterized protein MKK02DRAFT_34559 [Dioszegia hungarica]KAI9633634.1 hypothetical protein MKK02DRAFT_34559 [Dioszegia hungarica]